ncbi:glutamate-1-semialdehyde 2,1-aminomutase [Sulfoacidibacillus thermotolerans]|uniref:Glutamate-1-semialdehyde 2,1-aminomutase n=1 Tax=Sulfoacidibacillus thermotolerans TaxID=1765684 RepID=A0A2U3DC46_SULT2|nr:glutamate-1-semialdehyde 2,1-aminomutase [Sulfoacidibacillus thermotolerans]PWI58848.1 glutamate-1-semialdehyde-2,1-aminomutase [Sulfoacidibacillus thermotolerans]
MSESFQNVSNEQVGEKSAAAFARAKEAMPGGVNSPVRAFRAVGGTPPFIARGNGAYLYDIDGRRYIDYLLSWGPLIAGHAHPLVVEAVTKQAQRGTSFGAPTEIETELAEEIKRAYPSMELVRMVNSGTEATMSALRLARGYTGRSRVVKFTGCYHGHADSFLIRAGSGVATFGLPDSPGVPSAMAELTLTVPYNDIDHLRMVFEQYGEEIAAVIIEPVAGNMGLVLPQGGFLQAVRELTRAYETVLIFDEVMTGFRVSYGGAQERFGIDPDLTTLGKVIGGGMPVGAYGGKREIMELVAPDGPIYQAGTLSGNPLAMAAGLATLKLLQTEGTYERLEAVAKRVSTGFVEAGMRAGFSVQAHAIGAMFGNFFAAEPIVDYESAKQANVQLYSAYFHEMLSRGIYFAPSQLEAGFVSLAHTDLQVDETLEAMDDVMQELRRRMR